jgi:GNAT superfamily N-acetyltransferase
MSFLVTFELVDPREPAARDALRQYLDETAATLADPSVGVDELDQVDDYYPPSGAFLIAVDESGVVGCGAVRTEGQNVAEIKRMWIHPSRRGRGLGAVLLDRLEGVSRQLGHRAVRLDTNEALVTAIRLRVEGLPLDRPLQHEPRRHALLRKGPHRAAELMKAANFARPTGPRPAPAGPGADGPHRAANRQRRDGRRPLIGGAASRRVRLLL